MSLDHPTSFRPLRSRPLLQIEMSLLRLLLRHRVLTKSRPVLAALDAEARFYHEQNSRPSTGLYLGGGTPSLLLKPLSLQPL